MEEVVRQILAELSIIEILMAIIYIANIFTAVKTLRTFAGTTKGKILEPVMDAIRRLSMSVKKNEILMLINLRPEKIGEIEQVYDEYKKLGGNSYIDTAVGEWREIYEKHIIREHLEK